MWTGSGAPRIVKTPVLIRDWSSGKAPVESRDLNELMALIEQYLAAIFELVITNRDKSSYLRISVPDVQAGRGST